MSTGNEQGREVAEENEGFAGCLVFAKQRSQARGLKKGWKDDFSFSHSVRNEFTGYFLFSLGVRNWFAECVKFCTPCEISLEFCMSCEVLTCPTKFSQGVRIALVFPLPRIFKDSPNRFEVLPAIDHKKPKLNQTKIKLKREIKIKTSNNT